MRTKRDAQTAALAAALQLPEGDSWWQPQPQPRLDETHCELRPACALARALACCVCGGLLAEAITAPECSHSYCYGCGSCLLCTPLLHVRLQPSLSKPKSSRGLPLH
jgi:hypothetical protein